MLDTSKYIGNGIIFPLELSNGKAIVRTDKELIRASIITILLWPYNQRFFLAEFGSKVDRVIGEPNDEILKNLVYGFIIDSITKWERRIEILEVIMTRAGIAKLNVSISYRIKYNRVEDTFTFPFYTKIIY